MAVLYGSLSLGRLFQQSQKHVLSGRHEEVSYPFFQTKEESRSLFNNPTPVFLRAEKTKFNTDLRQESKFLV